MEISSMNEAIQFHAQIVKSGSRRDLSKLFTFSALSPMGDISYAALILRSLPSPNSYYFNTLIRAYSHSPDPTHPFKSLLLFLSMHQEQGSTSTHLLPLPDKFTYPFLFKSCARLGLTQLARQLHGLIFKSGLSSDCFVQNSLIHMYSEFGDLEIACELFDRMPVRDVVSWTSMIDGLVENDLSVEAVGLFEQMLESGIEINEATVVSVLKACSEIGALMMGKRMHEIVEINGFGTKANVRTALIDMYAKCGCINSANKVFKFISDKDVFAWTSMISGLASHGRCRDAIDLFNDMISFKIKPDDRTMTAVLSACRNACWVKEGYSYFHNMQQNYGVKPSIQHYGCMVDLLARAGLLNEAEEFIRTMPVEPDDALWRNLVWACKVHGDIDRGERLIRHLKLLEKGLTDCGSYILAGNLYALAGKWNDKAKVRGLMNEKGLIKPAGSSKIEIDGAIHQFSAGDSGHSEAESIYRKLDEIYGLLKLKGYEPKFSEVLLEVGDNAKFFQLQHHSEKLAVSFGLIKTKATTEIRIVKNLRSCEDCHEFMKWISRIYQREIIMRDRIRFHHFMNGKCSCKNCW